MVVTHAPSQHHTWKLDYVLNCVVVSFGDRVYKLLRVVPGANIYMLVVLIWPDLDFCQLRVSPPSGIL